MENHDALTAEQSREDHSSTSARWPFGNMRPLSYGLIMADPPWRYQNWSRAGEHKGAAAQYSCLSIEDIKALPVGQLAFPDSVLILWATNPLLDQAFDVLAAWGFTFKTAGHWVKKTKHGKLGFGTGYILRGAGEPFLIGTIGKPQTSKSCRSVIEGLTREHSRKPDEAYKWAEKLLPDARRADLFSRENRPGWDSWGNESGKFDSAYDGQDDFAKSLDVGYSAIRERQAAGGPGWTPSGDSKETDETMMAPPPAATAPLS